MSRITVSSNQTIEHQGFTIRALNPATPDFDAIETIHNGELFIFTQAFEVERFGARGEVHRFVLEGISTFGSSLVYPLAVCYVDSSRRKIAARILFEPIPRRQYRRLTRKQLKSAFADQRFQRLKA